MNLEKLKHLKELLSISDVLRQHPQFNEVHAEVMKEADKVAKELGETDETTPPAQPMREIPNDPAKSNVTQPNRNA